jgi:flagellin
LTFDTGDESFTATATLAANGAIQASEIQAGFVAAGFAADGTGEVNGFSLELNGAADIAAAIGNGDFTVVRADGTNFSAVEATNFTNTDPEFGSLNGTTAVSTDDGGTGQTAGAPAAIGSLADGDFTIQVGDRDAVSITGEFADASEFVDAINSQASGVFAQFDSETNSLTIDSAEEITIGGTDANLAAEFDVTNALADSGNLDSVDISTVAGANDSILRIDSALNAVNGLRGELGAIQNRFESTIANLSTSVENLSASNSRILDADFAAETANLAKSQVLQQAGISVLAQANARPQQVLSLLQ